MTMMMSMFKFYHVLKKPLISNIWGINKKCLLSNYDPLKQIIGEKTSKKLDQIMEFRKKYNNTVICEVTVDQIYSGMRGIRAMTYETSLLDPDEGICLRGFTIREVLNKLPKYLYNDGSESLQPTAEGIFWLLCTGDIPTQEQAQWLSHEWARRSSLPNSICRAMDRFPENAHPMAQFSAALSLLSGRSKYAKAQNEGTLKKSEHWKLVYEDCMDMIAKIASITSKIYRNQYHNGHMCSYDSNADYAENLVKMMGFNDKKLIEFMRLYLIIHCDHEGGNVSAHTNRLVASANSDPYIAFASSINGLSGPLHGRANQEVAKWLDKLFEKYGYNISDDKLAEYVNEWIQHDVIPGYGHAVLRKTDPRFIAQLEFAEEFLPNSNIIRVVKQLSKVVPDVLKSLGKVKNPYPNVDAISGSVLECLGVVERDFYTVPFGVSRAIGVSAALIWDKALGLPLERPKSITTDALIELVEKNSRKN